MNSCKAPQCEYSQRWKKCVRPNCYIEAMSWCKRNGIAPKLCKKNYNKEDAEKKACDRYAERIAASIVKSKSKSRSSRSSKSSRQSQHIFVRDVYDDNTAASKIAKFIKNNVMLRSETLQKRINYHKSIQYYLKNVPYYNCLTPKTYIDKDGRAHKGFDFDTTLKLIKQIGSNSAYGAVYQTSARSNILNVATKLMPVNRRNKQEVILNNTVTSLVMNKTSRHFLISYRTFRCNRRAPNSGDYPQVIRSQEYYVTINELAHGDLKMLCQNRGFLDNDALIINVIIQCHLAIYTFHQLDYCHNDCHLGNFLFQVSKVSTGYYHYIIEGKSYYLKNCGYTMMIYDFGRARSNRLADNNKRFFEDYFRLLNTLSKTLQGNARVTAFIKYIDRSLMQAATITNYLLPVLMSGPIPGIFVDRLPTGETIVNRDKAFYIDRLHCNVPMINPLSSSLSAS